MQYPWLQTIADSMAASLAQDRMPHALLLTGQPGVGKAALADTKVVARLSSSRLGFPATVALAARSMLQGHIRIIFGWSLRKIPP